MRGIDTLTALGLCSEIGEWERFDHPDQLSAYLGIVPSEHTTGAQRRLGSITKAGSTHARRLLVEAAYHYRRGPVVGTALERRQRGQAPEVINISWRAQRRLNARWRQLRDARKNRTGSSPSRSPESSQRSAGRSPPGPLIPIGFRRHPCRRATPSRRQPRSRTSTHQRPAKDSRTHAKSPQPVAAGEAARAVPARAHNSAIRRLSTRPWAGALDFRQRTCDEQRSWGTQPPNMSMTNRREPRKRPGRPANRNHITNTTSQALAINPAP